jgi:hypothetical protein
VRFAVILQLELTGMSRQLIQTLFINHQCPLSPSPHRLLFQNQPIVDSTLNQSAGEANKRVNRDVLVSVIIGPEQGTSPKSLILHIPLSAV